jgi:serine/threonine-protein kinase
VHAYLRANPQRAEQATLETEASRADLKAVRRLLRDSPPAGAAAFDEGSLLAGRYLLEQPLGAGSSATVYRAIDVTNNQPLALKLATFTDRDVLATRRFRREALLATRLVHANIVRVYDMGQHHGHCFMTMELVDGVSLASMLAEGQKLVLSEACALLLQALAGLSHAHGQGVVHRDVKPENMLVSRRGVLKLTDFGLAKGNDGDDERLTTQGTMGGTPSYISPEQIMDVSNADARSDLYSLGAMAYELFTGQPPFEAPSLTELLLKHLNHPPAPPRSLTPALPDALDAWVLRLLRKHPEERYRSSDDAARALKAVRAALTS